MLVSLLVLILAGFEDEMANSSLIAPPGLFHFVVKRIQGASVQPWLRTKPTDRLEIPINGESDRTDRTLLPSTSHGHEPGWTDSCVGSGR